MCKTPGTFRKTGVALLLYLIAMPGIAAEESTAYIYVLGIAQDAGYPQANCYRPHCLRAWENRDYQRLTSSIAVVNEQTHRKYLFDATPDIREQLYRLHKVAPDDRISLAGVFLTHGHIGHYTGLMHFGHEASGTKNLPVYAMPRMREFLAGNGPWSQLVNYNNIALVGIEDGQPVKLSRDLTVTALRVPHREEYTEAVGYRIDGPNRSALFIPDIDKWQRWDLDVRELIRDVDYAFLDGSFFRDGELPNRAMADIPHPFVEESMQLLSQLSEEERARVIFIHFNHTNPILIEGSEEQALVEKNGFRFAREGMKLPL